VPEITVEHRIPCGGSAQYSARTGMGRWSVVEVSGEIEGCRSSDRVLSESHAVRGGTEWRSHCQPRDAMKIPGSRKFGFISWATNKLYEKKIVTTMILKALFLSIQ